jgi:hypothetical protein
VNALLSALADISQRLGHVASIVLASSFIIVGGLVIMKPALLGWIVGLIFILLGIAVLAGIFTPHDRYR